MRKLNYMERLFIDELPTKLEKFVIYGLISSEITWLIWFIFSHFIST